MFDDSSRRACCASISAARTWPIRAPQVEAPLEVDADQREAEIAAAEGAADALRDLGAGVLRCAGQHRLARGVGEAGLRGRLAHARIGELERRRAGQRFVDQAVELRVAERGPPVLFREGRVGRACEAPCGAQLVRFKELS
jgi:hypothetical protein